jgi:hypothetical protein
MRTRLVDFIAATRQHGNLRYSTATNAAMPDGFGVFQDHLGIPVSQRARIRRLLAGQLKLVVTP